MVALRSRRLETLFGVTLGQLEEQHLAVLVTSGTQESFDLDFKVDHYGSSDSKRRELAGDVAAMANTAGGVVIIGVQEDDQARAISTPGVVVTDAEVARIRQVVAALLEAYAKPLDNMIKNWRPRRSAT
ncbi:MAG: AlbA family DNA-binding domain-containing protein [Pseudonocardiaceae bacterium]